MAYLLCSHVDMLLMILSSFIWRPCFPIFPKCKSMCRLSHQQNAFLLFVNLRLVWMPSMMISIFLISCNSWELWLLSTKKIWPEDFLYVHWKSFSIYILHSKISNALKQGCLYRRCLAAILKDSPSPQIAAVTLNGTARWPTGSQLIGLLRSVLRTFLQRWTGQVSF